MLGKISSRSISSYVFASAGLVHPCQMRAIIVGYDGRTRPQPARRGEGAPCSASNFEYEEKKEEEEEEERETLSHARYLIAAIDVNYLASDRCGSVAGEENSGGA